MGRPSIDITGKKFGNLNVISKTDKRTDKGQVLWELKCDCGETCFASSSDLNRGRRNFCESCNDRLSKLSPFKSLYGNYKRNAEKRGYSFELTLEQFVSIVLEECVYCGEPPNQWFKKEGAKEGVMYNGIDRFDNSIGYNVENAKSCCKFCNLAKNTFPSEDLISWLDRVAKRRNNN